MGISFEQAGPVAADMQAAYGAIPVQQWQREQQLRQQQLAMQAGAGRGGGGGGGSLLQNLQFHEQDLDQRRLEHAGNLGLARDTLQAGYERDEFAAGAAERQTRQRFEMQAWLQQQELSQAEAIQLQRRSNALGQLQADHASGLLSDDEFTDAAVQLRSGIDTAKQRKERSEAKAAEAKAQQMQQAADYQAKATKMFEQSMAQGGPPMALQPEMQGAIANEVVGEMTARGMPIPDQQTMQQEIIKRARARGLPVWVMHKPGEWKQETAPKEPAAPKPEKVLTDDQISKQAEGFADDEAPPNKVDEKGKAYRDQAQHDLWIQKKQQRSGELRNARDSGKTAVAAQPQGAGGGAGAGGGPPQPTTPPEQPEQRQQRLLKLASGFQDAAARVERRPDLPPERRDEYAAAARRLQHLALAYGTPAEMPPQYREEAGRLVAKLAAVPDDPAATRRASEDRAQNATNMASPFP